MSEMFENLFVFEIANNHNGSIEHGLRIIDEVGKIARQHHIRAGLKFQYRNLESFIHPSARENENVPHVRRFLSTRLCDAEFRRLSAAVKDQGLIGICTPFDEDSVALILEHGFNIIKVASCSANDWPLLEVIAKANKPVICSTGGKSLQDIDNIVSFFTHRRVDFALMHCVAIYPTANGEAQLNFIDRMRRRYPNVPIGYSGHEEPENLDIGKVACAKGATILERHVGVETETIKLNRYSMNPEQAAAWVASVLRVRLICGKDSRDRHVNESELKSLLPLMRGTYARHEIKCGEAIRRDRVFFAMPCENGQTSSGEYLERMVASRDYAPNEAIRERRIHDVLQDVRTIIHDAKGMLSEANIDLGKDFTIELSHHYGMQQFRQIGALLITVINREYCKKVIMMLPGQRHPVHFHKLKEETFHVLWGDLEVEVNGIPSILGRGDKLLIQRGARHGFVSFNGSIFEEISTAQTVGDSYYDDILINQTDPIKRKTVLEEW